MNCKLPGSTELASVKADHRTYHDTHLEHIVCFSKSDPTYRMICLKIHFFGGFRAQMMQDFCPVAVAIVGPYIILLLYNPDQD